MIRRYFECVDGPSSKFWEVWLEGTQVLTRYGRIGAGGLVTTKDTRDARAAKALRDKLIREKTGKGYAEKKRRRVPAVEAPAKTAAAGRDTVRLELVEGGAAKFWQVHHEPDSKVLTITWGKVGAAGKSQRLKLPMAWEAKRRAAALIEEKKRKGYVQRRR